MVYPSTFCQYNDKRSCGPPASISMPPDGFKYINTPLTLELSRSSVSVNGSAQSLDPEDSFSFANPGYEPSATAAFVSELADAFTTTFRITSRPTCKTVPADCDVPIGEGNTRVFWGGATPEFVLGTPELASTTDPVTNDLLYHEHQGGSGTAVYPYKFFFQRTDNPPENLLEQQYVDLYCDTDATVSPYVQRWYVVHETFKYCGGFTWDKWAGTIDTYGAPEDCGNISAGDPIPIGEPTMERSSGYPQLSAGGCGDPAPRIRFEIQAPCSV